MDQFVINGEQMRSLVAALAAAQGTLSNAQVFLANLAPVAPVAPQKPPEPEPAPV
jgi:hypothetical protein